MGGGTLPDWWILGEIEASRLHFLGENCEVLGFALLTLTLNVSHLVAARCIVGRQNTPPFPKIERRTFWDPWRRRRRRRRNVVTVAGNAGEVTGTPGVWSTTVGVTKLAFTVAALAANSSTTSPPSTATGALTGARRRRTEARNRRRIRRRHGCTVAGSAVDGIGTGGVWRITGTRTVPAFSPVPSAPNISPT